MSRHKSISDTSLLDRLLIGVRQFGPAGLSFARAAGFAGLSGPTLVQRFGSRDAMVEAVLLRAWDLLEERTQEADAASGPGAKGAVELLLRLTQENDADYDHGDGLLLLREDFRNPVLRERGVIWGDALAKAIGRRLPDSVDGSSLGWEAISLWQGAVFWWAFRRNGRLHEAVSTALASWRDRHQA